MDRLDWAPFLEWGPVVMVGMLPALGFLMVSNLRYVHGISLFTNLGGQFLGLVVSVFSLILFSLAPVPILFFSAIAFALSGILGWPIHKLRARARRGAARGA